MGIRLLLVGRCVAQQAISGLLGLDRLVSKAMARVTIEDCLDNVENMYELIHLATRRSRQIVKGADVLVKCKNRLAVTSLREIAAGKVKPRYKAKNEAPLPGEL